MIFDCTTCCTARDPRRQTGQDPYRLTGEGLWVGTLLHGGCTAEADGGALVTGHAGALLLGAGPLTVRPLGDHTLLCVRLTGFAVTHFLAGLPGPCFVQGAAGAGGQELVQRLEELDDPHARQSSRLAFELLCLLGDADEAAGALPALVQDAVREIRTDYMRLYGVDDLSERVGVSKSHLVRAFSRAMGITPGRYLVQVRVEAAKALLLDTGHTIETIAALCGFSGANYLCKVFKRETGLTPAAWRAANRGAPALADTPFLTGPQDDIYM